MVFIQRIPVRLVERVLPSNRGQYKKRCSAIWVLFVSLSAVGAVGVPVGLSSGLFIRFIHYHITAFGVAASVSDVLLVALLGFTIPFVVSHPQARRLFYLLHVLPEFSACRRFCALLLCDAQYCRPQPVAFGRWPPRCFFASAAGAQDPLYCFQMAAFVSDIFAPPGRMNFLPPLPRKLHDHDEYVSFLMILLPLAGHRIVLKWRPLTLSVAAVEAGVAADYCDAVFVSDIFAARRHWCSPPRFENRGCGTFRFGSPC